MSVGLISLFQKFTRVFIWFLLNCLNFVQTLLLWVRFSKPSQDVLISRVLIRAGLPHGDTIWFSCDTAKWVQV